MKALLEAAVRRTRRPGRWSGWASRPAACASRRNRSRSSASSCGIGLVDAQHLDRDGALDEWVLALVDDAHRTATEFAPDQVLAEAFGGACIAAERAPDGTGPSRRSAARRRRPPRGSSACSGRDGVVQSSDSGAPDISSAEPGDDRPQSHHLAGAPVAQRRRLLAADHAVGAPVQHERGVEQGADVLADEVGLAHRRERAIVQRIPAHIRAALDQGVEVVAVLALCRVAARSCRSGSPAVFAVEAEAVEAPGPPSNFHRLTRWQLDQRQDDVDH